MEDAPSELFLIDKVAAYQEIHIKSSLTPLLVLSTAFVESTVNQLIDKRMSKSQQMRWSTTGAHSLLQVRAEVVDGKLNAAFKRWYPGFAEENFTTRLAA